MEHVKARTIKMRKHIKIWFRAIFLNYPYWRVTYSPEDVHCANKKTRLLYYGEAKSLKDVFGGKLWIDYTVEI